MKPKNQFDIEPKLIDLRNSLKNAKIVRFFSDLRCSSTKERAAQQTNELLKAVNRAARSFVDELANTTFCAKCQ